MTEEEPLRIHPSLISNQKIPRSLGLLVLDSLRAEEESWPVGFTFVQPPVFDQIIGNTSVILYGGPGAGKTTLSRALESTTDRFVLRWTPTPNINARLQGTKGVQVELESIFSTFALELAKHLIKDWAHFERTPGWAKKVTAWFLKRFIPEGFDSPEAAALLEPSGAGEAAKLEELWGSGQVNYIKPETPYRVIVDHLMKVLAAMGWPGAFVLVDGLEGMSVIERDALAATLDVFLSSLFLFDDPRFHYKLFLPESLEQDLAGCSAIERQRVSILNLFWTEEDLKGVILRRLACATGQTHNQLKEVFADEKRLMNWLIRCGGASPRACLTYFKPILAHFLDISTKEKPRPLHEAEWVQVRQRSVVRFLFDIQTGELTIGSRKIDSLTPGETAILRFLYEHQNKRVSKEELYREAVLPFYSNDAQKDASPLLPKDYEDSINTALWRLRKEIEPDPKKPIFLISERDKGVMLRTSTMSGG